MPARIKRGEETTAERPASSEAGSNGLELPQQRSARARLPAGGEGREARGRQERAGGPGRQYFPSQGSGGTQGVKGRVSGKSENSATGGLF